MESDAYLSLLLDLQRYIREEVSGRSYLIAGHRGAGKTATVQQAIRVVRNKSLLASVEAQDSHFWGRRRRPQRPLLVKVVGKGLLDASSVESANKTRPTDAGDQGDKNPDPHVPLNGEVSAHDLDNNDDLPANALVHITIALYRALAGEVGAAAELHARSDQTSKGPMRREVAAQLALLLDSDPDAALLRHYWQLLGRLKEGLLWPQEAFGESKRIKSKLEGKPLDGQGWREIIAITTAAKAFQICSSRSITEQKSQGIDANNKKEVTISSDASALVQRVVSVLAGTAGRYGAKE